jgi:hypothetical protein
VMRALFTGDSRCDRASNGGHAVFHTARIDAFEPSLEVVIVDANEPDCAGSLRDVAKRV